MIGRAGQIDRTHPASVWSCYVVHVSLYVQPEPPDLNDNFTCQRSNDYQTQHIEDDRTLQRLSPVIFRELSKPLFCD